MSQRIRTLPLLAVALVALAAAGLIALLVTSGSGSDAKSGPVAKKPAAAAGPSVVRVKLLDFKIDPSLAQVPTGKVTFVAQNAGDEEHEMVVVRTDKPAGSLLKGAEASEAGAVDEIGEFGAGKTERLTVNLKPGHYVLLCNVPGHYKAGMYRDFTVR